MKSEGRVVSTDGKYAVVATERRAACEGCHKRGEDGTCSVCTLLGGETRLDTRALNRAGAVVGDTVELESSSGRMLGYAALVFILPCVIAIAAYAVTAHFISGELYPSLAAVGGFAAGLAAAALYSKFAVGDRADVVITRVISGATGADPTINTDDGDYK